MRRTSLVVAIATVTAALAARPAAALPCDAELAAAEVARIRAHLDREATRARRWNLGWTIAFGVLAAGQVGLRAAEWVPLDDYTEAAGHGLELGAIKATIAMGSRIVLPLKVVRAPDTGDPCADLEGARRAVRATARNEKRSFWLNHLGGLALNLTGVVLLGTYYDSWREGAKSFVLGYPVGLLSSYTQPRGSWHFDLQVGVAPSPDGAGVVVTGRF